MAFRIFPEHVEVDVLHSEPAGHRTAARRRPAPPADRTTTDAVAPASSPSPEQAALSAPGASFVRPGQDGQPGNFADWMSVALRREGLTQEAAARLLGVSVKTVSRWVGGATEPRLRDLRRIQEVFGEIPLQ